MDDPIGYFLTWVTYGTWLPGDARGWVEYRHGSIRHLYDETSLEAAILYVAEGQDRFPR